MQTLNEIEEHKNKISISFWLFKNDTELLSLEYQNTLALSKKIEREEKMSKINNSLKTKGE